MQKQLKIINQLIDEEIKTNGRDTKLFQQLTELHKLILINNNN